MLSADPTASGENIIKGFSIVVSPKIHLSGNFTCQVTTELDSAAHSQVYFPSLKTNIFFYTFVFFQNLVVLQRTRVVEHPSHLTIKQGEEAFLRCAFSTDPDLLSSFEIHWLFGEERLDGQQDGEVKKHDGLILFSGKRVKSGGGRPLLLCRSDQAGYCNQQSCMADR